MASYQLTLKDRTTEVVDGADAYQQEGQMTTFFRTRSDRSVVDTWSTRVASFRTSELMAIRRVEVSAGGIGPACAGTGRRALPLPACQP